MFQTKCGCPYCKGEYVADTRNAWKSRRNKHGRGFGVHPKPKKPKPKHVNLAQFS